MASVIREELFNAKGAKVQKHRAKGQAESPVTDMSAIVGAGFPRQIPNVLRYSCMFIEPGVLHDVVGILGDPTPTDSVFPSASVAPLR